MGPALRDPTPPPIYPPPTSITHHSPPSFYNTGYADGHAHGALHGLFEGRALGQEKAWELWEEVGFYEGFARVFLSRAGGAAGDVCGGRRGAKTLAHARSLMGLIEAFPMVNPTAEGHEENDEQGENAGKDEPDLAALLQNIRARYRLLCTSVGARPRLVAAARDGSESATAVVEGIEGPMKGVDTRQLKF
jgi:hypothetical protein